MKTSGVLHSILQLVFATYDCSIRKNVTIRLIMHRNALFEAVHNFSSFFYVLLICHLFLTVSIMGINGYKTNGEKSQTPVYLCKTLFTVYLQSVS